MKFEIPEAAPFIAGSVHLDNSAELISLINPSTQTEFAKYQATTEAGIDLALNSAIDAQRLWIGLSINERVDVLEKFAALVDRDSDVIAVYDSISVGRPVRHTTNECAHLSSFVRYWAGLLRSGSIQRGDRFSVIPNHLTYTSREALGIVASIQPWNGPSASFIEGVSPILACGNAVLIKPSELSPLSALHMAKLMIEAGAPPGLVNVLPGYGNIGARLIELDPVKGVAFTGSVTTGRLVGELAGKHLKKATLELGGKSPNIVFADANLREAAIGSLWGIFYNTGQLCCAGTRILVERSVAPAFIEELKRLAARIVVGDALDPKTHMGPVASAKQFATINSFIEIAKSNSALFECGGGEDWQSLPKNGFFISPTVLSNVSADSPLVQEEIFGPVVSIIIFDNDDEALALANNTKYGLAAKIWTTNVNRMLSLAEKIEAGSIWGNSAWIGHPALPFGGFKSSGIGSTNGIGSIEAFTQHKTVAIRHSQAIEDLPQWADISDS